MTDQSKQLAIYNGSTALLVSKSEDEIKEVARKLMRMTPGGNRLTTDQATDLAVYSFITQLNPFNNECYYMDKVGPVPGIVGYRVKATQWLRATSPNTLAPRTEEEYRPATQQEADFDPDKGDIAWVCILSDSVSTASWEKRRLELMRSYREMGAEFHEAYELAAKDAGNKPCWQAVGVVKADEHFSGNVWRNNQKVENEYKPEMWDRNERAKKRAAKGCYRKGFPEVNIPDAEEGEVFDAEVREIKDNIVYSLNSAPFEKHTEAENMAALGFETETEKEPAPVETDSPMQSSPAKSTTTMQTKLVEAPSEPADWPVNVMQYFVKEYKLSGNNQARNMLNLSDLPKDADIESLTEWVVFYKKFRAEGDHTPQEAGALANAELKAAMAVGNPDL